MNTGSLKLCTPADSLDLEGQKISSKHEGGATDSVFSTGKHPWHLRFDHFHGGYGMPRGNSFLDIGFGKIIFAQFYEHSRGGHTDGNFSVFSVHGKKLFPLPGSQIDGAGMLADDQHLIYLDRKMERDFAPGPLFTGKHLNLLNLKTGNLRWRKPINFPGPSEMVDKPADFTKRFGLYVHSVKFAEKRGVCYLKIEPGKFLADNYGLEGKIRLDLAEFLS